jgi:hypothetical protein
MGHINRIRFKSVLIALSMVILGFIGYSCETTEVLGDDEIKLLEPEGTVSLTMSSPADIIDGSMYIEKGNFKGAIFASMGKVKGIGSMTTIPRSGWANSIAVAESEGYVAYSLSKNRYWRIYVSTYTDSIVRVKHHSPFIGSEKEIQLETKSILLDKNSNSQYVEF